MYELFNSPTFSAIIKLKIINGPIRGQELIQKKKIHAPVNTSLNLGNTGSQIRII